MITENLKLCQRFQYYFARAMQMSKEEYTWDKICAWLKSSNLTNEEIALIKQKLNEESRLH